jgi:hypothetical protein
LKEIALPCRSSDCAFSNRWRKYCSCAHHRERVISLYAILSSFYKRPSFLLIRIGQRHFAMASTLPEEVSAASEIMPILKEDKHEDDVVRKDMNQSEIIHDKIQAREKNE